jgi:hypothetical protein
MAPPSRTWPLEVCGEGATARHRDECQAAHNGEDDSFPGHESMVQVRHKLRIMTR